MFLRSGGCQNGAKIAPKMLRKLSSGAGGLRESLRELLEGQEAPQRLPRAPRENPRSVPGGPKEVQNEPQDAPNDPQEGQNEPQEGQSELREVPGGFRERFGLDFSTNATHSTRKPCFLRSGRSQHEAKMLYFDDVFEPRDVSKNVTPWLSGRLGGAAPLEIRPLSLTGS